MKKVLSLILSMLILLSVFGSLTALADDTDPSSANGVPTEAPTGASVGESTEAPGELSTENPSQAPAEIPTEISTEAPSETEKIHVPQIRIVTRDNVGVNLQKDDGYVPASIEITDTDGAVISEDVNFKVRGNGTALKSIKKKAYTFKFSKKRDLLGLGKGKKWALLANALDVTLLRNYIALDFAQKLDIRYTSSQKMVELWVDGSFRGLYLLTEPIQEGKDRVNIDIESNGGMNDFLIEREANREEEGVSYFKTGNIRFAVSEPEEPDQEQLQYIKNTMDRVFKTIRSGTEAEIREAIDVASFVRFYLLNEYVNTVDFDYSSVFFCYQDGKLCAGPPWDYDHSMGSGADIKNLNYATGNKSRGVFAGNLHFYKYLCGYEWFMDEVRDVYLLHRAYIASIAADGGLIDSLAEEYSAEIERNFTDAGWDITKKWSQYQRVPLPTYQENLDYLKEWCQSRFNWLDSYLVGYEEGVMLLGDTDCDGEVTIIDATAIQRVLAELDVRYYIELVADADQDGEVTIMDATAVQRFVAELVLVSKIGQPIAAEPPADIETETETLI